MIYRVRASYPPAQVSRPGRRPSAQPGANASQRFIEFFTANVRNSNTRAARARAMRDFLDWRDDHGRELHHTGPVTSAGYIEQLGCEHGAFFAAAS